MGTLYDSADGRDYLIIFNDNHCSVYEYTTSWGEVTTIMPVGFDNIICYNIYAGDTYVTFFGLGQSYAPYVSTYIRTGSTFTIYDRIDGDDDLGSIGDADDTWLVIIGDSTAPGTYIYTYSGSGLELAQTIDYAYNPSSISLYDNFLAMGFTTDDLVMVYKYNNVNGIWEHFQNITYVSGISFGQTLQLQKNMLVIGAASSEARIYLLRGLATKSFQYISSRTYTSDIQVRNFADDTVFYYTASVDLLYTRYCIPECYGKDCGPDGCGGVCGDCTEFGTCNGTKQCGMLYKLI